MDLLSKYSLLIFCLRDKLLSLFLVAFRFRLYLQNDITSLLLPNQSKNDLLIRLFKTTLIILVQKSIILFFSTLHLLTLISFSNLLYNLLLISLTIPTNPHFLLVILLISLMIFIKMILTLLNYFLSFLPLHYPFSLYFQPLNLTLSAFLDLLILLICLLV
jgi:hypothetical protein